MGKTIKQNTQQRRSLTFERVAVDEEKRTVELAFSSESIVDRGYWREILDHSPGSIRLERLMNGAPLLADHENSIRSQIGVIESVRIDGDRIGRAVVRFGKSASDEEIYQKVIDGIIRNVSVGYFIHQAHEESSSRNVSTMRVTDWEPFEISLVAAPFDSAVGVGRSLDDSPVINLIEDKQMAEAQETVTETRAAEDLRNTQEQVKRELDKEKRRVSDIMALGNDYVDYDGSALAQRAINDGKSIEDFQKELLAKIKERKVAPVVKHGDGAQVTENQDNDTKAGFRNLGDFCHSVMSACLNRGEDKRLTRSTSTFSSETVGPDGGYAVPKEFAQNIATLALEEQSLLALCDNTPISGNTMTFPKDEGTPWGSSGIQAYWENEGAQATNTKESELKESTLKLKKLRVLVGATEELLADSTAMSSHITRKMGIRLDWKIQDAIVNGIGSGQPLGIRYGGSTVSQAKETSQTADTINGNNVAKMLGRVIMGPGANTVWLINPDSYNQLITMTLNNNPVWTPPNSGFKNAPSGMLLGRPVIQTDACQTLGDEFDIILANMSGYQAITKAGGMDLATSMHLWFDQDLMAFRLIFRMDGKPLLGAAVTPPNSSVTRSHFVSLAARA